MSKIICSAAIRGAQKIFERSEGLYKEALAKHGPDQEIGFPNTAYYLPIIYAMTGMPVEQALRLRSRLRPLQEAHPAARQGNDPVALSRSGVGRGHGNLLRRGDRRSDQVS